MEATPVKNVSSLILFSGYSELLLLVQTVQYIIYLITYLYIKITYIHPDLLTYITIYKYFFILLKYFLLSLFCNIAWVNSY